MKKKKKNEKGLFEGLFSKSSSKKLLNVVREFDKVNAECSNRFYGEFKSSNGHLELFIASREKVAPKTRKAPLKGNEEVKEGKTDEK